MDDHDLVLKPMVTWGSPILGNTHICIYPIISHYRGISIHGCTQIAGWFIIETTIKLDDLGVSPFQEYIYIYYYIYTYHLITLYSIISYDFLLYPTIILPIIYHYHLSFYPILSPC